MTRADTATTPKEASVDDLYRVPGKAELVGGRLKVMGPAGGTHGAASLAIAASLRSHAERTGAGTAFASNVGFLVDLPNRRSFSPDTAYYVGTRAGRDFLKGAPRFAVDELFD